VPVYAVGCDRGVHYYAMQFIDGQSLAAVIRALRPEAPAAAPTPLPGQGLSKTELGATPALQTRTTPLRRKNGHARVSVEEGIKVAETIRAATAMQAEPPIAQALPLVAGNV